MASDDTARARTLSSSRDRMKLSRNTRAHIPKLLQFIMHFTRELFTTIRSHRHSDVYNKESQRDQLNMCLVHERPSKYHRAMRCAIAGDGKQLDLSRRPVHRQYGSGRHWR
jgi:hypothetical protein